MSITSARRFTAQHRSPGGRGQPVQDLERVRRCRVADAGVDRFGRERGGGMVGGGARGQIDATDRRAVEGGRAAEDAGGQNPCGLRRSEAAFKPGELNFRGRFWRMRRESGCLWRYESQSRAGGGSGGNSYSGIGSGKIGLKDGRFKEAELHQPQGLAVSEDGETLYIADTENHAIRAADLVGGKLTTIAGTGRQGAGMRISRRRRRRRSARRGIWLGWETICISRWRGYIRSG